MPNPKNSLKKAKFKMRFSWKDIFLYGFLFLFFLFLTVAIGDLNHFNDSKNIPISQYISDVKSHKVKSTLVSGDTLTAVYKDGSQAQSRKEPNSNVTQLLKDSNVDPSLANVTVKDD